MNGARILVVDDEHAMASMLHEFLSSFCAQVDTFNCPFKALQEFSTQPDVFDLVITDQTMPGMTGMDLAASLLKLKPKLPIILCTGFNNIATPEAITSLGIAALFIKPVKVAELILKAQELLKR